MEVEDGREEGFAASLTGGAFSSPALRLLLLLSLPLSLLQRLLSWRQGREGLAWGEEEGEEDEEEEEGGACGVEALRVVVLMLLLLLLLAMVSAVVVVTVVPGGIWGKEEVKKGGRCLLCL